MSKFTSCFASAIESMLDYRVALGFSRTSLEANLIHFDHYCVEKHPNITILSKEMVFAWMNERQEKVSGTIHADANSIRQLAKYLLAIGQEAYVLPEKFYPFNQLFLHTFLQIRKCRHYSMKSTICHINTNPPNQQ